MLDRSLFHIYLIHLFFYGRQRTIVFREHKLNEEKQSWTKRKRNTEIIYFILAKLNDQTNEDDDETNGGKTIEKENNWSHDRTRFRFYSLAAKTMFDLQEADEKTDRVSQLSK